MGDWVSPEINRRDFLRVTASAALGASLLGGVGAGPAAAVVEAGRPRIPGSYTDANGVRRSLAYFGIHQPLDVPGCSDPEDLESMLGRKFAINHYFRNPPEAEWGPICDRMQADKNAGRIPMLSYAAGKKPGYREDEEGQKQAALARLIEIADGDRDAYIDGQAVALAALDTPVFLRFTWEFDIRYFGPEGAAALTASWRHVWARFRRQRAANVAFVWCPTWLAFQDRTAVDFYPGDRYVDWVAADGYSRDPDYRSFASLFTAANTFALDHSKPFMVAETGVHRLSKQQNVTSGSTKQSIWLDDLRQNLDDDRFANMKALLYFHTDGNNHPQPNQWRVTIPTNGPAFRSFNSLARNPRLQAIEPAPGSSGYSGRVEPAGLSPRVR
ncbi:MAG: hypothetical protein QOG01_3565 [Pseudonocardiales bacterium]|jgi:hypothetical protein|nr:hypothetical protein [Pseudonocardiales bacterium]